jgi:hypothetical protein
MFTPTMHRLLLSIFLCAMMNSYSETLTALENESLVEDLNISMSLSPQYMIDSWYEQCVKTLPLEQKYMIRNVLLWMITYTTFNSAIRHFVSVGTGFAAAAQRAISKNQESSHYIEKAHYLFGEAQKIRSSEQKAHGQMNNLLQAIEANPELEDAARALEIMRLDVQDLVTEFINQDASTMSDSFINALNETNSVSENTCKNIQQTMLDTIYSRCNPTEAILEVSVQGYYQYALAIEKLIYQSKVFRNSIYKTQVFAKDIIKRYFNKIEELIRIEEAQKLSNPINLIPLENIDTPIEG